MEVDEGGSAAKRRKDRFFMDDRRLVRKHRPVRRPRVIGQNVGETVMNRIAVDIVNGRQKVPLVGDKLSAKVFPEKAAFAALLFIDGLRVGHKEEAELIGDERLSKSPRLGKSGRLRLLFLHSDQQMEMIRHQRVGQRIDERREVAFVSPEKIGVVFRPVEEVFSVVAAIEEMIRPAGFEF